MGIPVDSSFVSLAATAGTGVLAQVAGAGALADLDGSTKLLVTVGVAAVAAGTLYAAATAKNLQMTIGYFVLGAIVAAAGGYLLADLDAVPFAVGAFLLLGSAAVLFATAARGPAHIGVFGVLGVVGGALLALSTDAKTAAFVVAAVLIVYTALKVLQATELVHATLWLAGMLVGVAGVYLSLAAEFLAVIQLLIYVGAVITLFLFTVMLTIPAQQSQGLDTLDLPPGVTIENVEDLEEATPRMGAGPYKGFTETNPRKPVRAPPTLTGVAIADGVIGDETTKYRRTEAAKEGPK